LRIGLYDIDSKIPNLGLMRLSAFHKAQGDEVELYLRLAHETYDRVYASSIFDFSDKSYVRDDMIIGGTGFDLNKTLPPEVEGFDPDYSLYDYPHNIGFAMRGCRFKCGFCVVPRKEGKAHSTSTIRKLITNKSNSNFIMLLDNDFFGNPNWKDCIEEIKDMNLRVNFSQGLNIRIISEKQAQALASVNFRDASNNSRVVNFAWDNINDEKTILRGFKRCIEAGLKPRHMQFYVLIGYDSTYEEDLHRVETIKKLGSVPYVMPFNKSDPYQKKFTHWVNSRKGYKTCKFEDFDLHYRRKEKTIINVDKSFPLFEQIH
jgi:hypothetical protein